MVNMNQVVGSHNILLMTLDTLRYDVADVSFREGRTPNFRRLLPGGWEMRHSPGSFTYAAHQAFFAGFLPSPAAPGKHPRLFALRFPGSETTVPQTCVLNGPDIVTGLKERGYHTVCIGGVGFFNQLTPLGRVLPALFAESYWQPKLGVTDPCSTENQFALIGDVLRRLPRDQRVFLFVNISAIHQPNYFYLGDTGPDTRASHQAALEYVDRQLPELLETLAGRPPWFGIVCSDHGTAYGEDGYSGHRLSHPVIWTVPYAEFFWPRKNGE